MCAAALTLHFVRASVHKSCVPRHSSRMGKMRVVEGNGRRPPTRCRLPSPVVIFVFLLWICSVLICGTRAARGCGPSASYVMCAARRSLIHAPPHVFLPSARSRRNNWRSFKLTAIPPWHRLYRLGVFTRPAGGWVPTAFSLSHPACRSHHWVCRTSASTLNTAFSPLPRLRFVWTKCAALRRYHFGWY